jgi:hypothetical protein
METFGRSRAIAPQVQTRRALSLLLLLLLVGLLFRIRPYAACPSYWYDEAYLLLNVFHRSFGGLLGPLDDDQAAPPLFLWALRAVYLVAGRSEWCMRLPALLASLAGLVLLAPLAARVAGRQGMLWAVAFCALGHHACGHAAEVKPYALDFLVSAVVLLAALSCLQSPAALLPRAALSLLALLAPWASYPAVFLLGSACLSLLADSLNRNRRILALSWLIPAGLLLLSGLGLWLLAVRHQASLALSSFWGPSFLDRSSPQAAIGWSVRCLIEAGNYGTREMGLPMVLLALVGAASLAQRRSCLAVLLVSPFLLALAASAVHCYPLGGRLLFFLVPCLWLLAAQGIVVLTGALQAHGLRRAGCLPLVLMIPSLLWAGRFLLHVTPRCQFREAFAFVHEHCSAGDPIWVSHPQVYEVYYDHPPQLSAYSPVEVVARAAGQGRLWMIGAVAGTHERPTAPATVARIEAACVPVLCQRFRGLKVTLYSPRPGEEYQAAMGRRPPLEGAVRER